MKQTKPLTERVVLRKHKDTDEICLLFPDETFPDYTIQGWDFRNEHFEANYQTMIKLTEPCKGVWASEAERTLNFYKNYYRDKTDYRIVKRSKINYSKYL